jgi:putative Mg2+ transporter-C (MgtC) family protein
MPFGDQQHWFEVILRVGLATLAGGLVGVNRDMHHKPIGLRTLGLVSLGCCLLVMAVTQYAIVNHFNNSDAASRVTQGIISGIGFLGAGVIMRSSDQSHVYGLTTAAAIVTVAALGVACALADWPLLIVGFAATLFLLATCSPIEEWVQRQVDRRVAREAEKK